jgi:putative hydrolase of the HAD superfamily
MVLIFDLDDTLYEEITYVKSGFRSVAQWLESEFAWDEERSYRYMRHVLEAAGRGRVFDRLLQWHDYHSKTLVQRCVWIYRHHRPQIRLTPAARDLFPKLAGTPLYLVTDGHKLVQAYKVAALGIHCRFRKVYLTHRYGLGHAKPALTCFERIRARERCGWKDMVHVADNPAKDFVNLTPLGVRTIRVLTGAYRDVKAPRGYDATCRIPDLSYLPGVL